jgi:hypothetical protein
MPTIAKARIREEDMRLLAARDAERNRGAASRKEAPPLQDREHDLAARVPCDGAPTRLSGIGERARSRSSIGLAAI